MRSLEYRISTFRCIGMFSVEEPCFLSQCCHKERKREELLSGISVRNHHRSLCPLPVRNRALSDAYLSDAHLIADFYAYRGWHIKIVSLATGTVLGLDNCANYTDSVDQAETALQHRT